ncbi:hypothetical protein CBOM_07479 [Ceraceosorus bombacis]|uniref:Uncharacterized protein n=1 Tax=Ceraceosorus bombacis TaxID=401625 RepID=A0A0N7L9I4_9BASI|nr:hypothetical protein CBOM_07479 [Ceraceosorus bombacis]
MSAMESGREQALGDLFTRSHVFFLEPLWVHLTATRLFAPGPIRRKLRLRCSAGRECQQPASTRHAWDWRLATDG